MTSPSVPSDPDKVSSPSESPPKGSRRSFFGWVITAIAGFIGVGLGVPLAGYVIAPALKRRETLWAAVEPTGSLHTGVPEELEYASTVKDGWRTVTAKKGIWAIKQPAGEVVNHCAACHKIHGEGGKVGADLSYVGDDRPDRDWHLRHFRDPQSVAPGSIMPKFPLTDKDITDLSSYMLSLKNQATKGAGT